MLKESTTLRKSLALATAILASSAAFAQTEISDEAGLKAMSNNLAGSYVLTQDITLSGELTPIGTADAPFTGTLNGNGHTIKGLSITTKKDDLGFFGYTSTATITNVRFVGAKVLGDHQAGIVAGQAIGSTISNVLVAGYVTGYDHVGAIVGDAKGSAADGQFTTISDCVSLAGALSTTYQAGGIAGWTNAGTFANNVAYGPVTAPSGGAAGITGMIDNSGAASYVNNASVAPYISGTETRTHGINGWKNGEGCTYIDQDGNLSWGSTKYYVNGALKAIDELTMADSQDGLQGATTSTEDLKKAATWAKFSSSTWAIADGKLPMLKGVATPVEGGDVLYLPNEFPERCVRGTSFETGAESMLGTAVTVTSSNPSVVSVDGTKLTFEDLGDAVVTIATAGNELGAATSQTFNLSVSDINYTITTPADLRNVKYNLAGDFKLGGDIDMTGEDFTPISEFTGTFDGQGHYITGLKYENADKDCVGLFGQTNSATIKNVGLKNAHFVGNANTGGIVGRMYAGTVSSCAVLDSYIEGRDHVGAIAGEINNLEQGEGDTKEYIGGTVSDNFSNSQIKSRQYQAGGIIGTITCGTLERNLFAGTDDCPGRSTGMAALVDRNDAPSVIRNNVAAFSHIYGETDCIIINTAGRDKAQLSNNRVLATAFRGASASSASACDGLTNADDENGLSTSAEDLRSKTFYTSTMGWDFDNTWKFIEGTEGKAYPVLKWMDAPLETTIFDLPEGKSILYKDGLEYLDLTAIHGSYGQDLSFELTKGAGLASMLWEDAWHLYAGDDNGMYSGSGDVDVKVGVDESLASLFTVKGDDTFTVYIGQDGDKTEIATADDFVKELKKNPQGDFILTGDIDLQGIDCSGIAESEAFSGTLDGNGHKIMNATASYTSGQDKGIICKTSGATIKNVAFANFKVSAGSCNHVGLIGSATSTKFEKVAVVGTVSGDDHVALLAGDGDGSTVTDCYVDGTVNAGSQTGGFFGCTLSNGATFSNSYFNGSLVATHRGWTGGFVGLIDKGNSQVEIQNCVSIGNCNTTDGSPRYAAPFICGNGSGGDTANALIIFKNNVYNNGADMGGLNSDWPANRPTLDGGEIEDATGMPASNLQQEATYTNLGWDFDNTWTFASESGYLYPVLKQFGAIISTGIGTVSSDTKASVSVAAQGGVLTVAGLDGASTVSVMNIAGQKVAGTATTAASATVALPGTGLYIVSVKTAGKTATVKVVNK